MSAFLPVDISGIYLCMFLLIILCLLYEHIFVLFCLCCQVGIPYPNVKDAQVVIAYCSMLHNNLTFSHQQYVYAVVAGLVLW